MGAAETIRSRRQERGLTDVALAAELGLSIYALGDLELRDDEIETAVPLGTVRRLCDVLGLAPWQVLGLSDGAAGSSSARELMKTKREQKGYSELDLGECVGFDASTIADMENRPLFANTLPVFLFRDLEHALSLPQGELLLGNWQ